MSTEARTGPRWRACLAVGMLLTAFFTCIGAPAQADTPDGPFTINVANREDVRQFWYSTYLASNGVAPGWTGSIAGCNPGTVSADYRDATLTRTNFFRAMAGVPSDLFFTAANNDKAQAAALIMAAQGDLSHDPEAEPDHPWACWSRPGDDAAGTSSLALGQSGASAITGFMGDSGTGNEFAGHRRNMLDPQTYEMGSGSVPGGSASEAQYFGAARPTTATPRDGYIAWPPKGYVPYPVVFARWSFTLDGNVDFTNATLSMTRNGAPMSSQIISKQSWSGPGMVFVPNGMADGSTWAKPSGDDVIGVNIGNVLVNGSPQSFSYTTTIFDPADPDPSHTTLAVTGPNAPPAGQSAAYSVNQIPNATGYQWRTTKLSPYSLFDGAEAGLGNWDAVDNGGTPIISDVYDVNGENIFQLNYGSSAAPGQEQSITLKKRFVPSASTTLTFLKRAVYTWNTRAAIEVSDDDGATWNAVYTEPTKGELQYDEAFTSHSVSLAAFAGRQVALRLKIGSDDDGGSFYVGNNLGWFLEDIALSGGVLGADAPVLSATSASRSFSFTPAAGSQYDLQVRANFAGSGYGAWSAAKRITPTATATALQTALDNTNLSFTTTGSGGKVWTSQTGVSHDGVDAARSGAIGNSATSTLVTTVTGPTKLKFWWRSNTQAGDALTVTVDGTAPFAGISGNTAWEQKTIDIASGTHTVRWIYTKNASGVAGADAVYVDQVTTGSK